jgi:hypothetical protein
MISRKQTSGTAVYLETHVSVTVFKKHSSFDFLSITSIFTIYLWGHHIIVSALQM